MLMGSMPTRRGFFGGPRSLNTMRRDPQYPTQRPEEAFNPRAAEGGGMPLPGPVSGYGGGTFNLDGSVATPVDRLGEGGTMLAPGGPSATAVGWPTSPDEQAAQQPIVVQGRSGMFGNRGAPAQSEPAPFDPISILPPMPGNPNRFGQSFDYDAVLASMLPQRKKPSGLEKVLRFAAPVLMGLAGNQAGANAFFANQQARREGDERQRTTALATIGRWKHDDFARQHGADLRAGAPRVIGRSMMQFDPQSGGVNELYDGPEDFETYAETMGLEPGTQEYFDAVEDYVLKSDGPAAYERDTGLDDYRTGNRLKLEGARQGNRLGLEGVRQRNRVTTKGTPTYRDSHPRAGGSARPTATGPNGQKVEWDGKAWVAPN